METVNKLETQTSIESNNNNDTNAEVTKLLNNDTLNNNNNNNNNESNSDTKTPTNCITTTTNGGGNKDTSFMFFSSSSKLTYKPINGKIRKPGANYVFKQENIKSYTDTHGIVYNINGKIKVIIIILKNI